MEKISNTGDILFYTTSEGEIKIDVSLEDETVWLTIDQMCELFSKSRSTVNEHILNVFSENELDKEVSTRKIGNSDFSNRVSLREFHLRVNIKNVFIYG